MKKRLRGLLSLWLAAAMVCSLVAVPAAAAPSKETILYTGFDVLEAGRTVYDRDYENVTFQAGKYLKEMTGITGWKAQALEGWKCWTGTWDSGNQVTNLAPLDETDRTTTPEATLTQEAYNAINADYLLLEPVLKPYHEAYFYTGSTPVQQATSSDIQNSRSNQTAIILDTPLDEQTELMDYASQISNSAGTIHSGWKLWGVDVGSGNVYESGIDPLPLDGKVTQANVDDYLSGSTLIEAVFGPKYQFTQQPTAENDYTVAVNEPGEVQGYAWYPAQVYDVVDTATDVQTQIPVGEGGDAVGTYGERVWTATQRDSGVYILRQTLPLQAGDILTIDTEGVILFSRWFAGSDYGDLTKTDTGYSFTAGEAIEVEFDLRADTSFTAAVTLTRAGQTPVDGQTAAAFTGTESGAYVCKATFPDGVTITSDPVAYTYTAPPAAETPTPTVDGFLIFANGAEIKIVAGKTEGYTNILYDQNNDNTIGDTEYLKIGNTDPTAAGYDLSAYQIYGGGIDTNVDGAAKVTMTGGKISFLYGGGWAKNSDVDVKGTEIILSGGYVHNNVFGGGRASSEKTASVTGNTKVTLSESVVVRTSVYGGGEASASNGTVTVTGNAAVTMTGGTVGQSDTSGQGIHGGGVANQGGISTVGSATVEMTGGTVVAVYGGGLASGSSSQTNVTGAATVSLSGDAEVSGGVYGGGYTANSGTSTSGSKTVTVGGGVKIGGSTAKGIVINGGTASVANGVGSFVIANDLTDNASVNVQLPAGYEVTSTPTIATGAVEADLAKIKLVGGGAEGNEAYFENNEIKVRAKTVVPAHTHAMSVDCSATEGDQLAFDKALTAATTTINASGNYYLAEDVTIENNCLTVTGANVTVNLCLNGHPLTAGDTSSRVIQVLNGATLNLCDCQPDAVNSTQITDPTTNGNVTVTGGLITGGKAQTSGMLGHTIKVADESTGAENVQHAALHLYGGTVAGNVSGSGTVALERGSFTLHGGALAYNTSANGCVYVYTGGAAAIAGGAIKNNHATYNSKRGAVYLSGNSGTSLTLSVQPVIQGNTYGTEKTPGNIYLDNEYVSGQYVGKTITIGENFAPTTPIGVTTAMTPTQESPVPITGANGADYSQYFKSDNDAYVIQNGADNVVQLALPKSNDATLSALTYAVGDGSATAVPGFAADTATYNVTLPVGTAADATITLTGTPAAGASITANTGVTLSGGSGTATLTVTAEDGTTTKTYTVNFVTTPAAPAATAAVIDYPNETISFADTYEVNTAADFTGTAITTGVSLTGYISDYGTEAQTLYIRVKAAGGNPAGAVTAVTIPARPQAPTEPAVTAGTNTLTVTPISGVEYTIGDWSAAGTTGTFTGLNPGTGYTVKARVAATAAGFKSTETAMDLRTLTALTAPTGADAAKGSVTADKTGAAVGDTVTYTVTFVDGWTPTLTLSGNHNALSGPVKGANNTWTYTYVVHTDDQTVSAAMSFGARQIESVSHTGEAVTLFADSAHNATADALAAYLAENVKVTPVYDNGTTGEAVTAAYALTTGTWAATGGSYTYTATAGDKTCDVPVTVKAVNATLGPVDGITKTKTAEGYADHAALGLPETVSVTYTGEGYTTKTDALAVSWSEIPADFGKNPGSHDFTGTVTLPAWATGGSTTSPTVTISDKTALTDGQMTLTMDGWTYGETAKSPVGSVTVTGDNGGISYQYSADSGASWVSRVDDLPRSTGGFTKAGDYLVRMNYEGDGYIGTKTAAFTVAREAITLDVGNLAASKPYDGTTTAPLTGAPAVMGAMDGDDVSATGGSGTYAQADAGTGIPVAVTGFTLIGADAGNYTTTGAVSGLTGTITPAEGTAYPGYAAALAELQKVHIVTNVTPTLAGVTLPTGWAFTGDTTARITASNDNSGKQPFPARYTPASANYAPVTLTGNDALFPVSAVALDVSGGLDMRTIESIGGTLTLSPVALKVTGAALPDTGPYAISNMEWSSSVERIATVTGSVAASDMSATITAKAKGVTMVGVAYQNGGGMLGYVLVQVVGDRTDSANTVEDITTITETLDKLIDPQSPSETDKKAVDAVADEVTKLPDAAKQALTVENVKALDELKEVVGKSISDEDKKLTITIKDDPEGQAPAPENVSVVGAAIACGVDSGNVVVTVKPVQPTGSDTKLELKMEMTVGGAETQLAAPMFFQMDVPEGIDLENLKLYHVKDDGSKALLPFTVVSGRTISFKMMSFSSVQFVVSTGGTSGGTTDGGGTTTYTLTATAGEGGKIAPSGKVRITRNSDKTFTITPEDGYEIADVLVDGKSVGAVGTYTFEKVKANHTIAASFRAEDERPVWNPFTDVKEGAWYYDSVKYVYENGLMNGTGKTTFSPGVATTRGMIVTILWRLEQSPESGAAMAFTDVKAGSYCYEAVRWAAEYEIVKGYTATAFGPDNTITRQELAAILYRYAQYKGTDVSAIDDLTAFTDHPDPWAEDAVKWAVGAGILAGKGGGVLDPRGEATRAQVAAMLTRLLEQA